METPSLPSLSLYSSSSSTTRWNGAGVEDICDPLTSQWLRSIYKGAFETILGSWMGKYSNPFAFGDHSSAEISVSISHVCEQLDSWMDEEYDLDFGSPSTRRTTSTQIAQSLNLTIHAYAARWLPVVESTADAEIVRKLWRAARRDMLKVINRPSYRSMCTLLLFALTPIPVGLEEEEEIEGISGQVCVHAALQQIQQLRARQRSLQFNGAQVNLTAPPTPGHGSSPRTMTTANFITYENIAYWAALTFDTSASLTLSCRPLLSSGLYGLESESWWRMVKTCREIFQQSSSHWLLEPELTDDRANRIIAAASAWKLVVWKLTANMKEALRDGHDEPEVSRAFSAVVEGIDLWNSTYRDLLAACQRRILFFQQETKLRWYVCVMHYHLSILIGVDTLAASERQDLLAQFSAKRTEAESWVLNCLQFGLNNKYTISRDEISATVPIMAIDPYAHHVVAAVKLMQQAIDRDFAALKISADAYNDLVSTLTQALQHLPASSKSVQLARSKAQSQPLYSQTSIGG
ncbi:uncharacterized protein HMPREF1541_03503 [Cyphellophora europaea CBS 101466]|uniref:Transcription factor domain-containing protein n=1 Tax=Cyphellophora europaea (strain CBS 101466) TaxID=1220924 RepID=W2RYP4_CYPE1|nr:uncharacterized protein HMPREF1541_03503 [Cyphellophora europaea CBS 101466]ETN41567.1 hypothetical protein HMPREF1541_03503 [Cyphellophora europaea CBS 101466]